MKVPVSWLKDYVKIDLSVEDLAHRLTMAGIEVSDILNTDEWTNCYVGRVISVNKHPNADRLSICTVDIGREKLDVVCGAPNVKQNQLVPFAKIGAELFNPANKRKEILKSARIRGVESHGMICSEMELGLGNSHTGIMILPKNAPVGINLGDYLGDQILDFDVTPNRPDCLSVLGIAREIGALVEEKIHEPCMSYAGNTGTTITPPPVEVLDKKNCRRYMATIINGVKVASSPMWLRTYLLKAGMRPINNIVDITNFVMLELGQPLHAFDLKTLNDGRIIVRQASLKETLDTLDEQSLNLNPSTLVICDGKHPIALAGIIGGKQTEISDSTTDILIESANFDPISVRRTSSHFNIRTEASIRFEKRLQPELSEKGLHRATALVQKVAGGIASNKIVDIYPDQGNSLEYLTLTMKRIYMVLGTKISIARVRTTLNSLGFECTSKRTSLKVRIPYWRSDINIEDDLIEEIARIIGYDHIPVMPLSSPLPHHEPQQAMRFSERVKDAFVKAGMQEVITYPLVTLNEARSNKIKQPLKILNPMNQNQEYLRTTLVPSLLHTIHMNRNTFDGPIRIFEIGSLFIPKGASLPDERKEVTGVVSGPQLSTSWLGQTSDLNFYDVKGIVEYALRSLAIHPTFRPTTTSTKQADIFVGSIRVGYLGEIDTTQLETADIPGKLMSVFSLDLKKLLSASEELVKFKPIIKFPVAIRDVSLLAGQTTLSSDVEGLIQQHPLVDSTKLINVYLGKEIPTGKKSLAYRIHFRSVNKTLSELEVSKAFQEIVESAQKELGVTLRT